MTFNEELQSILTLQDRYHVQLKQRPGRHLAWVGDDGKVVDLSRVQPQMRDDIRAAQRKMVGNKALAGAVFNHATPLTVEESRALRTEERLTETPNLVGNLLRGIAEQTVPRTGAAVGALGFMEAVPLLLSAVAPETALLDYLLLSGAVGATGGLVGREAAPSLEQALGLPATEEPSRLAAIGGGAAMGLLSPVLDVAMGLPEAGRVARYRPRVQGMSDNKDWGEALGALLQWNDIADRTLPGKTVPVGERVDLVMAEPETAAVFQRRFADGKDSIRMEFEASIQDKWNQSYNKVISDFTKTHGFDPDHVPSGYVMTPQDRASILTIAQFAKLGKKDSTGAFSVASNKQAAKNGTILADFMDYASTTGKGYKVDPATGDVIFSRTFAPKTVKGITKPAVNPTFKAVELDRTVDAKIKQLFAKTTDPQHFNAAYTRLKQAYGTWRVVDDTFVKNQDKVIDYVTGEVVNEEIDKLLQSQLRGVQRRAGKEAWDTLIKTARRKEPLVAGAPTDRPGMLERGESVARAHMYGGRFLPSLFGSLKSSRRAPLVSKMIGELADVPISVGPVSLGFGAKALSKVPRLIADIPLSRQVEKREELEEVTP